MANRHLIVALLTALSISFPTASAPAATYGNIEIFAQADSRGSPNHGYSEYRFQVSNRGSEQTHRVTIQIPGNTITGMGGGIRSLTRTVEIGPKKLAVVSIFQPALPDLPGNGAIIYIDGRKQEDVLALNTAQGYGGHFVHRRRMHFAFARTPAQQNLLSISQRIPEGFFNRPGGVVLGGPGIAGLGMPGGPPGGAGGPVVIGPGGLHPPAAAGGPGLPGVGIVQAIEGAIVRSDSPISAWSNRWLGYTRYDGIFVTCEDIDELQRGGPESKDILESLWRYVEAGGTMVVLGPGKVRVPEAWTRMVAQDQGLTLYQVGFGMCIVTPDRDSKKWTLDRWQVLASKVSGTGMPWRSPRGMIDLNHSFPVVDDLGVPVKGLFSLLMLFGVAIGPVNLVLLTRWKRRIWLLWTVPAMSMLCCLMVLGYMIVAEGWTGHARVAGFTFLDEIDRRATSLGKAAFYSPLTPGDGLRFSEETEVQIQGNEHSAFTSSCAIDWAGDQHLTRGWVTARVPAHFTLRKSEDRRERLNLRREADGSITVVNALGADIRTLWLADEKGEVYTAPGRVGAGEKAKLEKAGKPRRTHYPIDVWRQLYMTSDWGKAIEDAEKHPSVRLGPGMYLAILEETPFLEQGMKSARVRPSASVVLGILADLAKTK